LYPQSFLRLKFLCPPLSEQVAIVKEVNSLRDKITKASGLFESQIQTLQTLRSTLIAHAVTGKIAIPAATA
jgi:restriction endonuclease S subunit